MFKPAIAALAALSLTVATPALADRREDQLNRIIIGATALAIIGAAISNNNRGNRAEPAQTAPQVSPRPHAHPVDPKPVPPRPVEPPRVGGWWPEVPARCLSTVDTREGPQRILEQSCLDRNYDQVRQLPLACQSQYATWGAMVTGYAPDCLSNHGIYIQRR